MTAAAFFGWLQVVKEAVTIHGRWRKSHVIFEPLEGTDFWDVAFALHVLWALARVEIKDVDRTGVQPTSEVVATIGEADVSAAF